MTTLPCLSWNVSFNIQRSIRLLCDFLFSAHVRLEDERDVYRAIGVLIKLEDGNKDSRRGDDGVVERVAEDVFLRGRVFVAEVHSSRLKLVEFAGAVRFAVVLS